MRILLALATIAAPLLALARSSTGDKVLVILDKDIAKDEYSKFWASLEGQSTTY